MNGKNLRGGKISQISTLVLRISGKLSAKPLSSFYIECSSVVVVILVVVGWREFSAFVVVDAVCSLGNAADDVLRCFN